MKSYSLTHLGDAQVARDYDDALTQEAGATAWALASLAEFDARKLYLLDGYSSMFAHAVEKKRMSRDCAGKRIQAARAARKFPALFVALERERLNLSGVCMLAPCLTPQNAVELVEAAGGLTNDQLALLLAERFPRPDVPTSLRPIASAAPDAQYAVRHVAIVDSQAVTSPKTPAEHAVRHVGDASGFFPGLAATEQHAVRHVPEAQLQPLATIASRAPVLPPPSIPTRLAPLSPEKFELRTCIDRETHALLVQARDLLGHSVPNGDIAEILKRALTVPVADVERRRFAMTARTRPGRRPARSGHIPSEVRRAVLLRDGAQCTFVSESGHRCTSKRFLEFDHIEPVARGERSTVSNVRVLCHNPNQLAARRLFGGKFMDAKVEGARRRSQATRRDLPLSPCSPVGTARSAPRALRDRVSTPAREGGPAGSSHGAPGARASASGRLVPLEHPLESRR